MRHQAIYNTHSTVTHIFSDNEAYDVNDNLVTLDEEKVQTELDRLNAEYDALEYSRNREVEYPSIQDLVVALYDTDDKTDIEAKRAAVKAKYPKPD